jgi:xanthine dehydrogenase accessory factor
MSVRPEVSKASFTTHSVRTEVSKPKAMTPTALRRTAKDALAHNGPMVEVCVLDTRGSVPREAGTRMLVGAHEVHGTIGGGHLELKAIEHARAMLASRSDEPHAESIALGPALGQCCGGALTLRYARLNEALLAQWPAPAPLFHLQLYGAGHVGRAIVRLLDGMDCRVQWIDERDDQFPREPSAPHVERLCVEPVEAEVRQAGAGAHYLVLTHSHDLDLRITEAILKRGDFAFLGLIGSKTKRARFEHWFAQRGMAREVIERITCPIGVPGISGKQPEVIAVAVVAQLLQNMEVGRRDWPAGTSRR